MWAMASGLMQPVDFIVVYQARQPHGERPTMTNPHSMSHRCARSCTSLALLCALGLACDGDPSGDSGGNATDAATEGGDGAGDGGAGDDGAGDGAEGGGADGADGGGDGADGADGADGGAGDGTDDGGGDGADDGGPACGNGQLDPDEVCDGELGLDGVGCTRLGFVAGQVSCAADCTAVDDSGCSETAVCGDGEQSAGEACEEGLGEAPSCSSEGEGSGDLSCVDCQWNVATCCSGACTEGCNDACGADPGDLTGTWTIHFINNGWQGPDPTMIMELVQDGTALSGSFTTDAWYLGDHEFEGGERDGNDIYMHVPITQLQAGMIIEGTVCGGCAMQGVTDPQGGLNSDWVATRD